MPLLHYSTGENTNGGLIGGGVLKFSNKIAEKLYSTIGVELVNVKHSKENKYSAALGYGRTFIWAKQNYFFSFRGQYGREMILFSIVWFILLEYYALRFILKYNYILFFT